MEQKDYTSFVRCGKRTFDANEKRKYAGCLSNWSKAYISEYQRINEFTSLCYYFMYRQPLKYQNRKLWNYYDKNTLSRSTRIRCINKGYYSFPIYAYGQGILVIQLITHATHIRLNILSGYNDIFDTDLYLPLREVKAFITKHHKREDCLALLNELQYNTQNQ